MAYRNVKSFPRKTGAGAILAFGSGACHPAGLVFSAGSLFDALIAGVFKKESGKIPGGRKSGDGAFTRWPVFFPDCMERNPVDEGMAPLERIELLTKYVQEVASITTSIPVDEPSIKTNILFVGTVDAPQFAGVSHFPPDALAKTPGSEEP